MRDLTNAGLVGAAIGLALGAIEYFLAMLMIRRSVAREVATARKENEMLPGMSLLPETMRLFRIVLIVAAVVIYPIIGYVVGSMFVS